MKEENAGLIIGIAVMLLGVVLIGGPLLLGHPALQPAQPGAAVGTAAHLGTPASLGDGTKQSLVTANNTAVNLITKGKNEEATEILEPLLKANPDYGLARDNLAIAYNNQALKQTSNPKVALDSLWRSSCLSTNQPTTKGNISGLLTVLGKQPTKFEDRVAMGDAQMTEGCLYGAYAEYKAALDIHGDDQVAKKLKDITTQAAKSGDDDINGAFFVKMAGRAMPAQKTAFPADDDNVDYGPYMARLQRSIKKHWTPPTKQSSQKMQVMFAIARDGTVNNLRVSKSSGAADEDKAGLEAIKSMGKAEPLPAGSAPTVDIQFSFDYNVFSSSKGEKGEKGDDSEENKEDNKDQ